MDLSKEREQGCGKLCGLGFEFDARQQHCCLGCHIRRFGNHHHYSGGKWQCLQEVGTEKIQELIFGAVGLLGFHNAAKAAVVIDALNIAGVVDGGG